MGVTIDVLIPMLGRPHRVESILDSLDESADPGYPVRAVFICSPDDEQVLTEVDGSGADFIVMTEPVRPGDYARKTNAGFAYTEGEWVFLGASDLRFHGGWALHAVERGEEYQAGVVGTNDMGNPTVIRGDHSTHSLVRRSYIEETGGGWDGPGVVYHEGYFHQYVDTELVTAAQARGRWVFAHDSRVEHLHPLWRKGEMDDTYRRALEHQMGRKDALLFRQRSRRHVHRQVQGGRVRRSHQIRQNTVGGQDAG